MLIVQPNGLFARFTEVCSDFTHTNMTEQEAYQVLHKNMPAAKAEIEIKKAKGGHTLLYAPNAHGDGMEAWNSCIEAIRRKYGKSHATKRVGETTCL